MSGSDVDGSVTVYGGFKMIISNDHFDNQLYNKKFSSEFGARALATVRLTTLYVLEEAQ